LESGSETLRDLQQMERRANMAITVCCFIFFCVAAYVAHKRVTTSNTATYIVRPAMQAVAMPFRILGAGIRLIYSHIPSAPIRYPASHSKLDDSAETAHDRGVDDPRPEEASIPPELSGGVDEL
jgi:hypothetical protein